MTEGSFAVWNGVPTNVRFLVSPETEKWGMGGVGGLATLPSLMSAFPRVFQYLKNTSMAPKVGIMLV